MGVMLRLGYRLMLALILFAMVGGQTAQLAQATAYAAPSTIAGMPCDMMLPMADAGPGKPMVPCKGMTPDCIKQMGCVVDFALPAPLGITDVAVPLSTVAYWSAWSQMAGLIREPEPLPPRTT
jgi:hypothetical protein